MTRKINYIRGDLFSFPLNNCIIPHVTNDVGAWGSGFVVPLGNKYHAAKEAYLAGSPKLGTAQIVEVDEANQVYVANMTAQRGLISANNPHPLDYFSLNSCMERVREFIEEHKWSVHAPKFGSERAGGDWIIIEKHIESMWLDIADVTIYIYP